MSEDTASDSTDKPPFLLGSSLRFVVPDRDKSDTASQRVLDDLAVEFLRIRDG